MLDTINAVNVGWWRPWPFSKGSMEVTALTTGTIKFYGSNAAVMPANGFKVTVSGSRTAADTPSIKIVSDKLPNGAVIGTYTVIGGDSVNAVAAGLKAALVAALAAVQEFGAIDEQVIAAASLQVTVATDTVTVKTIDPDLFFTLVTANVGGTEVLTTTQYDSGAGSEVASVTASGMTQIPSVSQWFKVACTALTTGTPTAIVNGYS
jgi:hypothetical protein